MRHDLNPVLAEASKEGLLTKDEERSLLERAQGGDEAARRELLAKNTLLIVHIAKRYARGRELGDLIAEGEFGLMHAIKKFDLTRDIKFSTYASWWIKNSIRKFLGKDILIQVPAYLQRMRTLVARGELQPTSRQEGLLREAYRGLGGFDDMDPEEPSDTDPSEQLVKEEDRKEMQGFLAKIDARHRGILLRRFGFEGEPMTLQEIADEDGISRERVRQLQTAGLRSLRKLMKSA